MFHLLRACRTISNGMHEGRERGERREMEGARGRGREGEEGRGGREGGGEGDREEGDEGRSLACCAILLSLCFCDLGRLSYYASCARTVTKDYPSDINSNVPHVKLSRI